MTEKEIRKEALRNVMDERGYAEWIPVEEKLPIESGDYWVTMRHLDGTVSVEKYPWKPGYLHTQSWKEVVIAWQPYYCPSPFNLLK